VASNGGGNGHHVCAGVSRADRDILDQRSAQGVALALLALVLWLAGRAGLWLLGLIG
jgi:hypothetical protein